MVHFGLKVLFAASILYIVHPAESITCFQCKEEEDLRCATNVTTQINFINQCGAIGSEAALITKPAEVDSKNSKCLKAVLRLRGGGKTVLRTCVHDSATCESIMSDFPPEKMQLQECAFCKDKDLCNSGTSITVALSVLGISSLIHYLLK